MSINLKCKEVLESILAAINSYTGKSNTTLTDGVIELKNKSEKGYSLFREIVDGSVKRITAEDFGNITKIGAALFRGNTNLEYVEFPPTLTEIGDNCFFNCYNLHCDYLPDGITTLKSNVFYYTKVAFTKLPDALTFIDTNVFSGCTELRISEIPAGVTSISRGAFSGCKSLTSITFKGTPTSIQKSIFDNCTNITEINVPWAEGEVANAPWGATNATVNYNCSV